MIHGYAVVSANNCLCFKLNQLFLQKQLFEGRGDSSSNNRGSMLQCVYTTIGSCQLAGDREAIALIGMRV